MAISYEPTNWASGDVISSAKLNNLENGVVDLGEKINFHFPDNGFKCGAGKATGNYSHASGSGQAIGNYSHAEGSTSEARGYCQHAEGTQIAFGDYSHAEGSNNRSTGEYSHVEGNSNLSSGQAQHAEGKITQATEEGSHSEGSNTIASNSYSHAEGSYTLAEGYASHTEGYKTKASHAYQHVFGRWNKFDPSTAYKNSPGQYVEIVGNGANINNRSNARTLDWSGNESLAGSLTLGKDTTDEVTISAAQLKQLLALLNQ